MSSLPSKPPGITEPSQPSPGPYRAHQIKSGQPYELSNGYKIHCMSQSGRSSQDEAGGVTALVTDPANKGTGVDTGYTTAASRLRAPDIAVGDIPDEPGWVKGTPLLAVEYADTGQNEDQLQKKIGEFLEAGTRYIWVVRLVGPRRVEVYEPGGKVRLVSEDGVLTAPGALQNPVPVRALFEKEAALEVALRNLLNRRGYADLAAVKAEGKAEALLVLLTARGFSVDEQGRTRVLGCREQATLDRWLGRAAGAAALEDVFAD